jgi:hypothetical protein
MMRNTSFVVPFLFVVLGGCASSSVHQAKNPALSQEDLDLLAPPTATVASTGSEAPAPIPGDIQFTVADRKAKTPPTTDDQAPATTLQPQKSSTSGVTSTGVTLQHVHSSQ